MGTPTGRTAFDDRIRENEQDVLRYFQRRLLNDADAAEAFGELLLTAWKLRRTMPADPVAARMWLFATSRNVLLNTRRSLARRSVATRRFVDEMRTHPQSVEADDLAIEIRDAIAALPAEDAELVRLVYWDGFRSHEAAAVLGINPSTARSRLSRAKQTLRAVLADELEPTGTRSE
ncbi:RNA polymerase sigma factor [Labedella endophytica]|uniref:Sigma-70 family RNA polymerase sigma factor n=1 Tax=Labedella endophytica TaxID=1523160 RepID=A0A3S0VEQ1_9MICO|nr:sigma-70 family RNA polymerase sigma factor [Labedella endophytica]RUQ99088.1 sigma-70 family RNA polymerase sigma factor [Labedella endophytica]